MLIRRLKLKNIRSYKDGEETVIDFPEGVVLFEGDIGSGKSTILYALEFAFFGFSDLKGSHLLSEGTQMGRVSVTFKSGEAEYTIERHLKVRGREVAQDECYISSKGERTKLSPSDLKQRVVSILGYNEPTHPKAESLVYRYAVFTPQEQMKEILAQNPEDRMHVIRRILGAQSYQVAAENSEIVERAIKEIAHGLKRLSEDIYDRKEELASTARTVASLQAEVPKLKESEAEAARLVSHLEEEWRKYLAQRESLSNAEAAVPRLRQEVSDLRREISDHEETLKNLQTQLTGELEPVVTQFKELSKPRFSAKEAQSFLDAEKERLTKLADAKDMLEADIARTRDLVSRGVCPLCGQKIPVDTSARSEHSERELADVEEKIKRVSDAVITLGADLDAASNYEEAASKHAVALKDAERVSSEISSVRGKLRVSNEKLTSRKADLDQSVVKVNEMRGLSEKVADLERKLKDARKEDKESSLRSSQAQSDLASRLRDMDRLSEEVKRMQEALDESLRLGRYQTWLSSYFRPAVQLIENQTLTQAASRFNEHFRRFFTSLVDDPDMIVRVREDFTPVFEREGFEQDFEALSGGERTSMALAYRFALNCVARESISAQPELLILDEPTDGFSKEQVYKMRGLLEELGSTQVILVSHEKELESMADHVFRVDKRNGSSYVSDLGP